MIHKEQSITELVEQLPELYQPIYRHSEFNTRASRSRACFDRLETIISFYDYISKEKGRPLKVLDLGCAQGFFSLNLAERGAIVTAVDYSQPNINICNKLADENASFKIEFLLGSIETLIQQTIIKEEYDLVLGLSVFHHLVYEHGADYVFDLFKELSSKVETGIFEFALNSEPLYWASAQPEEPRKLIESYVFNHNFSMHGTHLSVVERPLYFASNRYWAVDKNHGVIEHSMRTSHQLDNNYHGDSRRYYFSEDKIIKIFLKDAANNNFSELNSESLFLNKKVEGFRSANLICYGSSESESWLVRTAVPGRLLLDIIQSGDDYDDEKIISDILHQVAILEENNLYHNDLRPWNIILGDDDKTYIIDYGSISGDISDGDDLYGQILSFFVLIKEIALHKLRQQGSLRPSFISPYDFPEKYKKWMTKVWMMPSHQWSFKNINSTFIDKNEVNEEIPVSALLESHISSAMNHMNWQIKLLQNKIDDCDKRLEVNNQVLTKQIEVNSEVFTKQMQANNEMLTSGLSVKINALNETINIINEKIFSVSEQIDNCNCRLFEMVEGKDIASNLRNELNLVYASTSWKLTYPLRMLSKMVRKMLRFRGLVVGNKTVSKKKSKNVVSIASVFFENHPLLKQRVIRLLNRYPKVKSRIKRQLQKEHDNNPPLAFYVSSTSSEDHGTTVEQEGNWSIKKNGKHESKKSVLESWFY